MSQRAAEIVIGPPAERDSPCIQGPLAASGGTPRRRAFRQAGTATLQDLVLTTQERRRSHVQVCCHLPTDGGCRIVLALPNSSPKHCQSAEF